MIGEQYSYIWLDSVYGNYFEFQNEIAHIIKRKYNGISNLVALEIGSGDGITTKAILRSEISLRLTTIDIDPINFPFAVKCDDDLKKVEFIVADALNFLEKCENNSFDFVVSGFTIHNFTKPYRSDLFQQILRVLKKDGYLINADKFMSDDLNKRIRGLTYRIGTYLDVLYREGNHDLLKYWIAHYLDDAHDSKALLFNQTQELLNDLGYVNVEFSYRAELEMLGILIAQKHGAM